MTGSSAPWRRWGGAGLVFLLSLSAAIAYLNGEAETARQVPDPWAIARQVERFAPLRMDLPAPTVLYYLTDVPADDNRSSTLFFGTAYALAPHVVTDAKRAEDSEMVVGSFQRRPDLARLESERGLKLVKDYGQGVMLFRRERK